MKKIVLLQFALMAATAVFAQASADKDPVIMTVNGVPVSRSEFE